MRALNRQGDPEAGAAVTAWANGCEGSGAALGTGWHGWQYQRRRWWWSAPWLVVKPWKPHWEWFATGGDEWCNPTLLIVVPLLGSLTVRYRRGPVRTEACAACVLEAGYDPCPYCGTMLCPSLDSEGAQ